MTYNVYIFGDFDAFVNIYRHQCTWCVWVLGTWHKYSTSRQETADLIRSHKRLGTPIEKRQHGGR